MRAVTFRNDQSLLLVDDRYPTPTAGPGEALVRVRRAGICSTDLEIVKGYMGFSGVLGHEFVGVVVEGPTELRGRRVVAEINCVAPDVARAAGRGPSDAEWRKHATPRTVLGILGRDGAFADYVVVPAENCHVVPDGIGDEEAVFVEPLAAAVQVVTDHPVTPATRAAVIGSGRLGILCGQVLTASGADVQVIGRNARTIGVCRQIGLRASKVEDRVGDRFDLVIECSGSPGGLRLAFDLIRPRGTIVLKSTYAEPPGIDLSPIVINEIVVAGSRCGPFPQALRLLGERRVKISPLIDGVYPLERAIEAFAAASRPGALKILLSTGEDENR